MSSLTHECFGFLRSSLHRNYLLCACGSACVCVCVRVCGTTFHDMSALHTRNSLQFSSLYLCQIVLGRSGSSQLSVGRTHGMPPKLGNETQQDLRFWSVLPLVCPT